MPKLLIYKSNLYIFSIVVNYGLEKSIFLVKNYIFFYI